jgi:hypothetical protein
MKNRILFTLVLLLVFFNTNAQDSLNILFNEINLLKSYKETQQEDINRLTREITLLKSNQSALSNTNKELNQKTSELSLALDSIFFVVQENTLTIIQTADSLGIKITKTETTANQKYNELGDSISKSTLYGVIALLFAILISIIVYFLLSKRQKTDKTEVIDQILKTKTVLEEEQIKLYSKITEIHQDQLTLIKQERENTPKGVEPDHTLAKKVAEEMVKMQMNLAHMDKNVRGHRHLTIAVTNVYDNLKANGYEVTELLGKPDVDGRNMKRTKELDLNLKPGEQIISRVIKPEIYYNGNIIQHAEVIVSFNE